MLRTGLCACRYGASRARSAAERPSSTPLRSQLLAHRRARPEPMEFLLAGFPKEAGKWRIARRDPKSMPVKGQRGSSGWGTRATRDRPMPSWHSRRLRPCGQNDERPAATPYRGVEQSIIRTRRARWLPHQKYRTCLPPSLSNGTNPRAAAAPRDHRSGGLAAQSAPRRPVRGGTPSPQRDKFCAARTTQISR